MSEIPDPLLERIAELEREVADRERRERQARCPHDTPVDITTVGDPRRRFLCYDCGAHITLAGRWRKM